METPFVVAAREGRINILKLYFEKLTINNFNPDARTIDGWTAFTYASINGFLNTVQYLASMSVNIHTSDRIKRNALHWAARFDNYQMVTVLLGLRLSVSSLDKDGHTPLTLCNVYHSAHADKLIAAHIAESKKPNRNRSSIIKTGQNSSPGKTK